MATKLYLHREGVGTLPSGTLPSGEQSSLTPDSNLFTNEDGSENRSMNTTISAQAQTSLTNTSTADQNAHDYYIARWVSPVIYQTSIAANTWNLKFAALEGNAAANFPRNGAGALHICAYVWKPSNGTKYGNIIDGNSNGDFEEASTTQTLIEGTFSGAAVSSLTSGDACIVFEMWARVTQGMSVGYTQTVFYDGTTESSTSNNAAFIETPETLQFENLTRIETNRILKWDITGRIQSNRILKWNIIGRIQSNRILKWNMLHRVGGKSLVFDGVNDRLECGAFEWTEPLDKFSFSIWVFPTAAWDGQFRGIITHNSGVAHGFECFIESSGNQTKFFIRDSIAAAKTAASTALVLYRWNNIMGTYDNGLGSANVKIFIDNTQGSQTANLTETLSNSGILDIANSGGNDLKGNAKDFRFWKDRALDSTQRADVMNNSPNAPLPDYWLKLDEGVGNPTDFREGHTATLQNGAAWDLTRPTPYGTTISRILRWNIQQRIQSNRILKWDITGRIQSSRILKWNINQRIQSLRILKWDILNRIESSRILKWDILNRIESSRILKWDILQQVLTSRILKWDIASSLTRITTSRILKWNINERIQSNRVLKWNILNLIQTNRILNWNIQQRIATSRILKWNIQQRIQTFRILKWNLQQRIQSSRILKWDILQRIQTNRILRWDILEQGLTRIETSRILKWNIQQRIESNRILKWNINERITSLRILKWNILEKVTSNRILKWNIHERVTSSRILKWNIQQRITSSRILKWDILERIQSSRILKWNILERIQTSRILLWDILDSGLIRIQTSRILKWNIQSRIQTSRILRWDIESPLELPKRVKGFFISGNRKIPNITSFLRGLYDRTGDDEIKRG